MLQLLDHVDSIRLEIGRKLPRKQKTQFGQFMTPATIARFMAGLFPKTEIKSAKLLDAGAGLGALSCAFLDRWMSGGFGFQNVEVWAYEIDEELRKYLLKILSKYTCHAMDIRIQPGDFIEHAVLSLLSNEPRGGFSHAILNPPYKKIRSNSRHRLFLRKSGIETVNLYSAFVALSVTMLAPGGYLVAIVPRSFCNGPYYKPFRNFILNRTAMRHVHIFGARNKAFKEDGVLQENIIIALERGATQSQVTISSSTDDSFSDYCAHMLPFDLIVRPNDPEHFINIPQPNGISGNGNCIEFGHSLAKIGVHISTGPVVDFRLREYLRSMPGKDTVPLLYPVHFAQQTIVWPQRNIKKPNALLLNDATKKWLYPNGYYVAVRRFSSKEERRRVVASVVDPSNFNSEYLGFENHLNVFHEGKKGLPKMLAYGLALYLNCTAVDDAVRLFNGHTQVNATDLRQIKYPSRKDLIELGRWVRTKRNLSQIDIDERVARLL